MTPLAVTAIFDIGKTNKKLLLFDEELQLVNQYSERISEITDEDGFPCDDLQAIRHFIFSALDRIIQNPAWKLHAVNFSAYGASLVYLDGNGQPLTPLYNYLKPYPKELAKELFEKYGGQESWSRETASPYLGSLNSGLQLYRLKMEQPALFERVNFALHLPQYCSFLLTKMTYSDITSIGCHTGLWDFEKQDYHDWVKAERLIDKLAPVFPSDYVERVNYKGHTFWCGIGLHDSSAALLPYIIKNREPFILLSTGTWCIALNPFNNKPLTQRELKNDCLCYFNFEGMPVKASRLFAGQLLEDEVNKIATFFNVKTDSLFDAEYNDSLLNDKLFTFEKSGQFDTPFSNYTSSLQAYHNLLLRIMQMQWAAIELINTEGITTIFVEGGFGKNKIFMQLLKRFYPNYHIIFSTIGNGAALGAALIISKKKINQLS